MAALQYTLNDYIAYIIVSNKKRLLVEGPDDNHLFNRLFDVFDKDRNRVDVDDASSLIGFSEPIGNREKVELVCSKIKNTMYEKKLVGFVDREFRGFLWNPDLWDDIRCHQVDGRVVWTRGHSIENYYFDFKTLKDPISTLSSTPYYRMALDMLERNFETVIRLACAASLTGMEIGNYQILRNVISWEVFKVSDGEISINLSNIASLCRKKKIEKALISQIIDRFPFWETLTFKADFDIVRWMCHGHMGLTFIWSSFQRMVFEVSLINGSKHPRKEIAHSLEARDEIKFIACAKKWIERALGNEDIFPFEVLTMLELVN